MRGAWSWWVGLWSRQESPKILAIVRILIGLVLLADLLTIARLDLVVRLWGPAELGGMGEVMTRTPLPELYRWFAPTETLPWVAWGVLTGAMVCFILGFLTPVAGIVALLVYAQLAQVLPLGDRGIDLMIRNVLLILSLSGCNRIWSVDALLFGARDRVPAWPRHLLIVQLLVMYFAAGIQKTAVAWWPWGGYSALYLVLQDPSIAAWRFGWLERFYPVTQLATAATMVFELLAAPMVLAWWYRDTRERPGRLRALFNRLDLHRWWMLVGVMLHVGIAATMSIGIFPYAMLAFYPAFFHPDELEALARRVRVRAGVGPGSP